jgi:Ricin-type beta-trefoil lectin domain
VPNRYLTVDGYPADLPSFGAGAFVEPVVTTDGRPLALLAAGAWAGRDRTMISSAVALSRLALEKFQLARRVLTAEYDARRRLVADLHDGAQLDLYVLMEILGTAQDTPVQIWGCKQVDEMRWQFTGTGEIQGFGGNCLTVVGDDADATPVLMEACQDTPDQHWHVQPDGHISYAGGRCLDIQGPSVNDGTALQIWQCKDVPEELWQLA